MPSTMSWRQAGVVGAPGGSPAAVSTTRVTSSAPSAKQAAFGGERQRHADREQERPDRRRTSWLVSRNAALEPRVRDAEVLAPARRPGRRLLVADVGERLRGPEHEQRDQDEHDADELPVTIVTARTPRTTARRRLTRATMRRRSIRSATTPAGNPNRATGRLGQDGDRDEERVPRLRRDQQRAGGQRDAVADVGDQRLAEQPSEGAAEARRGDGLDDGREGGTHRAAGYRRKRTARRRAGASSPPGRPSRADPLPSVDTSLGAVSEIVTGERSPTASIAMISGSLGDFP